jgi:hypothetical protein
LIWICSLFAQDPFEDRTVYVNEVQETSTSTDGNFEDSENDEKKNDDKNDETQSKSSPKK